MTTKIQLRRDTGTNWDANSTVVLSAGEIGVNLTNGQFKLGNGTSTWAELSYYAGSGGSGDRLVNGLNEAILDASGSLTMPATGSNTYNYQFDAAQNTTVAAGSAPTVVFNSIESASIESVKAIVKVSALQAPAGGFVVIDSQVCEMLITSRVSVPEGGGTMVRTAVATIYGVTHTSATPLATFTVNFFNNPDGPDAIQILAQPTVAVTGTSIDVQVVAIELMNYA